MPGFFYLLDVGTAQSTFKPSVSVTSGGDSTTIADSSFEVSVGAGALHRVDSRVGVARGCCRFSGVLLYSFPSPFASDVPPPPEAPGLVGVRCWVSLAVQRPFQYWRLPMLTATQGREVSVGLTTLLCWSVCGTTRYDASPRDIAPPAQSSGWKALCAGAISAAAAGRDRDRVVDCLPGSENAD